MVELSKKWNKKSMKAFRKGLGLTQLAFSELVGLSEPSIRNFERGKANPSRRSLSKYNRLREDSSLTAKKASPYFGLDVEIDWAEMEGKTRLEFMETVWSEVADADLASDAVSRIRGCGKVNLLRYLDSPVTQREARRACAFLHNPLDGLLSAMDSLVSFQKSLDSQSQGFLLSQIETMAKHLRLSISA